MSNTRILGPASNHACIRCGRRAQSCRHARIFARVMVDGECWLWTGARKRVRAKDQAYGNVWLDGRYEVAHRAFYQLLVGELPDGTVLRHLCDVGLCVNPAHLLPGTARDNSADMVERGRSSTGERNGQAKVVAADVIAIRADASRGVTHQMLGERFGVARSTIGLIVNRRTWSHIE